MGIFDVGKKSDIIKNEDAFSYEFVPKVLPYRENQIQEIANAIKPLLYERKGSNLFIHGAPGIGKTASVKWVLRELEETTDEVVPIYVNCWNLKTKYFIYTDIANQLGISFTAGKSAEHVLHQIKYKLKNKSAVFVFDEIDKIENSNFLYQILNVTQKSCVHLISNNYNYILRIDPRIKSRLQLRSLEFKPYSLEEIEGILKERVKLGLRAGAINPLLIKLIANVTHKKGDVRVGLNIIHEAAKLAEYEGENRIKKEHVDKVIKEVSEKKPEEDSLNKDEHLILSAVKKKNGAISGEIYKEYVSKGGKLSYKSFKRYVNNLERLGFLKLEKTGGGFKGKSTRIYLKS